MKLKVFLPAQVLLDAEVTRVVAPGAHGSFCLLPRHIDLVAPLVPGIIAYTTPAQGDAYLAVDEGVLVKQGTEVLVSTPNAVAGLSLGELGDAIEKLFRTRDDHERRARAALGRLEASLLRQLIEWEEHVNR